MPKRIEPFSILFYKGRTPIARVIRALTKSRYSHCGMMVDSFHIVQLDWKTPVSVHHLKYLVGDYDVYEVITPLTEREKEKIINYIRQRLSTTYDMKFIFSRFFNILFGTQIVSIEDKYNCDELIVEAYRHIGINLIDGDIRLTPETLSQSKLLRKIKEVD